MPYYACSPREFSIFTLKPTVQTSLVIKHEWPPNLLDFDHMTINVCGSVV